MKLFRHALFVVGLALLPAAASASVVTYMDQATLARLSPVIVRGTVSSVDVVVAGPHGSVFTDVTLQVTRAFRGVTEPELSLRLLGGSDGVRTARAFGVPTFRAGEDVFVFARPTKSGRLTVTGLFQGKVSVEHGPGGSFAVRGGPSDASRVLVVGQSSTEADRVPLGEWVAELEGLVGSQPAGPTYEAPAAEALDEQVLPAPRFTLLSIPVRRFEPDTGDPIVYRFNPTLAPTVPGGARPAYLAALAAWNGVDGHAANLVDGGDTTAECFLTFDGISGVSHDDPCGEMPSFDSGTCSGVLAIGGISELNPFENKVVNGTSFLRGLQGDVVMNDGAQCFWSIPGNYEEVVSHEIGHSIGLGHSCGDSSSPACSSDPILDDAQMRAFAHGDGRGADPRRDDEKGIRFIYPPDAYVGLLLNQASYSTGDTLELTLDVNGTVVADLWLFSVAPALGWNGGRIGTVPLTFLVDLPIAQFTFSGAELPGAYGYVAILTTVGGLPNNPAQVLSVGSAAALFVP